MTDDERYVAHAVLQCQVIDAEPMHTVVLTELYSLCEGRVNEYHVAEFLRKWADRGWVRLSALTNRCVISATGRVNLTKANRKIGDRVE